MNKNIKVPAVVGFILYAVAAFFSVAILTVLFDFCGLDSVHGTWIWRFGKLFTGVYGVCSVLIPVFLLVAAFQCFMQSWRVRNGVVLAGSVIPFFTLDAIEHIFRMLIAENSGDSLIMKLMIAALTGGVVVAIEFLVLSILGDTVEGSVKKTKNREESSKKDESLAALNDSFDIESILNDEDEENAGNSGKSAFAEQGSEEQKTEVVPEDNPFAHIFDEQDKAEETEKPVDVTVPGVETPAETETVKDAAAENSTVEADEVDATDAMDSTDSQNAWTDFTSAQNTQTENEEFEQSEQFADSGEKTVLSDEQAWNNWGEQSEDAESSEKTPAADEDEKAWENWKTDDENEELSDWNDGEEKFQEDSNEPSIDVSAEEEVLSDSAEVEEEDAEEEIEEDTSLPVTDDFLNEEIEDFPENTDFVPNTDFDDLEDDFADENEDAIAQEAQENYEDFTEKENSSFDGTDYSATENDFADEDFEEPVEAEDKKLNEARDYFSDDEQEEPSGSDDDGFGDEEAEDNPEGGDLSDFVEQRNSRFASIFAEMGRDAADSVKKTEPVVTEPVAPAETEQDNVPAVETLEEPAHVDGFDAEQDDFDTNFGNTDTDVAEETLPEDETDFADEFDSNDTADAQPFDDYEFDPTAEPVVDSNGMPFKKQVQPATRELPQAKAQAPAKVQPKLRIADYNIPVEGILQKYENDEYWVVDAETKKKANDLMQTLAEFNIEVKVIGIRKGPVVTMFEVLPAPGVNVNKIRNLQDNIALRLAATSVRIVSPIPGKSAVGIEIPNKNRAIVSFREIIEQKNPAFDKMAIPVILGKDISGEPRIIDLAKTPHLLIAGSTGSGKSVCVNSLILSILYKRNPNLVKLILIDPKVVELKLYNDIPHLLTPVITEPKKALQSLQYCICEMERRYALLDNMGVRDVLSYNRRIEERKLMQEKLPYIVIIIDEFADLMATTGKELESNVSRLAAMSRAVGIHLVLATQRPSVNVITGLIKANIPSRIAFMVASRTDSNIIIDQIGAEKLLGKGDMLYASATDPFPVRIQGTLVSDDEVEKVVEYVKQYGEPDYIDDEIFVEDEDENEGAPGLFSDGDDPLYDQALEIVVQSGKASASYLQRRLKIGYNRAARLVEEMEERGIVGPQNGSKPREVIYVP